MKANTKTETPRLGPESRVWQPRNIKHVIILGMGMSVYDWLALKYKEPGMLQDAQVWTINQAALTFKCDLCVSTHTMEVLDNDGFGPGNLIEYMRSIGDETPAVLLNSREGVEECWEYPLAEVIDAFGQNYFRNSIAYAIALALLCNAECISLYGCDFDYRGVPGCEHLVGQEIGRPNVEFWLGYAAARGVKLNFGTMTTMLDIVTRIREGLYGYGDRQPEFVLASENKVRLTGFKPGIENFAELAEVVENDAD